MFRTPSTVLLCALALGCADTAHLSDGDSALRITEGTPEAIGILAFLNDASTTFHVLDDMVLLDRRAADSLIHHRDGPDGVFGTADDDLYDSIEEVDARYYVGAAAIARIETWAREHQWVPTEPDDVLGTWDGVTFTVADAEATVELANTAGPSYLDDDLALDARAVDSIVEARPIATVQELAGLYYVGASALTTLKEEAAGVPACETPRWDIEYVYADDSAQWRSDVPAELAALVDSLLERNDWCGDAYSNPWFVKATIDRFNCEEKGYTIELGQLLDEFHGLSWYIEFEVDAEFDTDGAVCEV